MNHRVFSFGKRIFIIILCGLLGLGCCPPSAIAQQLPSAKRVVSVPFAPTLLAQPQLRQPQLVGVNPLFLGEPPSWVVAGFFKWLLGGDGGSDSLSGSSTAGRRGKCNALNQSFAAVMPRQPVTNNGNQTIVSGRAIAQTAALQPSVFVYLPDLSGDLAASEAEDVIHTEVMIQHLKGDKELDFHLNKDISIPVPRQGGLAEISFENLGLMLDAGEFYHWYFSIICDEKRPTRNPSVDAWVKVMDADERIKTVEELSRLVEGQSKAEFYIEKELWSEAFGTLMQLRCQDPDNSYYLEQLNTLLIELRLDEVAEQSIKQNILEAVETSSCPVLLRT
ncbi:MAG: DUF928 domain-containing protein [Cyanobacteria bacterium J06634_5]